VPFEFRLPDLGEGIREAQVLRWKVSPGQEVHAFEPLCDVESAKAAVELTSPVAGRVRETRVPEGQTVGLGEVLVVIDTPHDAAAPAQRQAESEWFGIVGVPPRQQPQSAEQVPSQARVLAAPFVRKLARDLGVRLEDVPGSGPQGRVRAADVQAAAAAARAAVSQAPELPPTDEVVPLRGLRKSIADHMLEAVRNAPQVTSMDLLDVTHLVQARQTLNEAGSRLNYLPFFVKAAIEALRAVPEANAIAQGDAIRLRRDYNIGIATAVPGGLVVPVVKHADRLSLPEIAREIDRLVAAARERRSDPHDLADGTFTITSFGGLPGSPLFATPILNYPQVAILGIGRIDVQPRVVDGQVVARDCVGVSFTFDHRVLDGEGAGRFMSVLKRFLEQPLEFLLTLR
jgi:pyruvate dehydrogenase E2 component (dihydrolipoamide acetyltransferase)